MQGRKEQRYYERKLLGWGRWRGNYRQEILWEAMMLKERDEGVFNKVKQA